MNISGQISTQPAAFPDFCVLTTRETLAVVMVFSSPKCVCWWCNSDWVQEIIKIFSPSTKYAPSLLSKTDTILVFDGSSSMSSAVKMPYSLPKHFACMPVIRIQFISKILPSSHFDLFHGECCGLLCLCILRMQRRVGFVVKPCLVG